MLERLNPLSSKTNKLKSGVSPEISSGVLSTRTKLLGALLIGSAILGPSIATGFVSPLNLGVLALQQGVCAVALPFFYLSLLRDLNPFKNLI